MAKAVSSKRVAKHTITEQDKIDWDNLYQYVKNLMGYDDNQRLSKNAVYRLKGLQHGKHMANNSQKDMSNYSFAVILNTFKYCQPKISKALKNTVFKDETHKLNYILVIVEKSLNDVYIKMKQAEQVKEQERIIEEQTLNTTAYVHNYKQREHKQFDDWQNELI